MRIRLDELFMTGLDVKENQPAEVDVLTVICERVHALAVTAELERITFLENRGAIDLALSRSLSPM
jgi:hypothetical protein